MAAAFVNAAVKVDHQRNPSQWVARRTLLNCERTGFAVVKEFDRSPPKPNKQKTLDQPTINAINQGIEEVCIIAACIRGAQLEDTEVYGID